MLGKRLINSNDAAAGGACTTNTNDYPITNLAYYKMSSAADEKDTYNGTATDVNFNVQGKFGNAAEFNGSSSYISIPQGNLPVGASARTVSMWINTTQTTLAELYGYGVDGNNLYYAVNINAAAGKIGTAFYANDHNFTASVIDGAWHHIVSVYNGSTVEMYADGQSVGSATAGAINTSAAGSPKIGKYNYTGKIDQVRIFSSALNATQVEQLYNEVYCVPTIVPTDHFTPITYTGTGGAQSTNSLSNQVGSIDFKPDFTWIKRRDGTENHYLQDSVRGSTQQIYSNLTNAQFNETTAVTSFSANGFNMGSYNGINNSSETYVAWNWKAGGAEVSVTGTNVTNASNSANVDAGFSIIKFTTNGSSNCTIPHGLSQEPDLVITFPYLIGGNWLTYSKDLGINKYIYLNSSAGDATFSNIFTGMSSSNIGGSSAGFGGTNTFIAYAFHSVDGYSKIGSYVGGGATDVTVNLGFTPAFVMIKSTTTGRNWMMYDNKRETGTVPYENDTVLFAESSSLEVTGNTLRGIQFTSSGFVLNQNYANTNGSGETHIFMAFAEEGLPYVTRNATNPFGDSSELALYKFEDNANDAEGNYNGTASNVTYASGYIDKAAVFNGSSSAINTTYTPTVANLRTVSLWFKTNATAFGIMQSVGAYGVSSNYSWEWIYMLADGKIGAGYGANNGGAVYLKTTTASYNDNSWHYLTLILNGVYGAGSSVELYIDGVQVATTTDTAYSGSISTITGTFRLGHNINVGVPANIFNGSIDQVRIFNRALDSGEVTALYNE